ncbi:hypothetical protein JTE90_028878 [Oedothorax gibbosus]|uniref:Uncharacterized protein n=1 Tax=Oedothorax gibbosus TaxID=931172 RepID=A0AAV6TN71_9ARAC|nr:hypothetical protein JTE90_028878 [Oedothorax gibbosus]
MVISPPSIGSLTSGFAVLGPREKAPPFRLPAGVILWFGEILLERGIVNLPFPTGIQTGCPWSPLIMVWGIPPLISNPGKKSPGEKIARFFGIGETLLCPGSTQRGQCVDFVMGKRPKMSMWTTQKKKRSLRVPGSPSPGTLCGDNPLTSDRGQNEPPPQSFRILPDETIS